MKSDKKGYTLIEIIIVIVLITILGSFITIIIINNNKTTNEKRLQKLHDQILEAANVFISSEKDENGENYYKTINLGAKGIKIPISYLVNYGYIDKDIVNETYKLDKLDNSKNYYVVAINGGNEDNQDYCETGDITFSLSWMIEDKPQYLCKNYKKNIYVDQIINNIQEVQNNFRIKVNLDKNAVSETYYDSLTDDKKNNFVKDENGIFTLYDENVNKTYSYYRGSVNNNYLKLGKDNNDNELIWRILWLNDDNKAKLILDNEIQLKITKKNGDVHNIKVDDTVLEFYNSSVHYYILNYKIKRYNKDYNDYYYRIKYDSQNLLNSMITLNDNINETNNIYYQQLLEWYNSTDLRNYSIITNSNNFCMNNFYYDQFSGEIREYQPNNSFDCIRGKNADKYYNETSYSSVIGFLTYGDVVRAGVLNNKGNITEGGSYLLKNTENSYPLIDHYFYKIDSERSTGYRHLEDQKYYINNQGLVTNTFYEESRDSNRNERSTFYSLMNENDEYEVEEVGSFGTGGYIWKKSIFRANSVKPAIIVDLTNKKLDGEGTINSPFRIIDKK